MANYKESKVVVAAAQAALEEASDEEDNRQIKIGESRKTLEKLKGLESMNHRLQDGNSQLQEQVKEANEQTKTQDQLTILDLQQQLQDAKSLFSRTMSNGSFNDDDDDKESSSDDDKLHDNGAIQRLSEMQNAIDTLQPHLMVLDDEKLRLQTALDSLEHQSQSQFVDVEFAADEQIKNNKTNNNEGENKRLGYPFLLPVPKNKPKSISSKYFQCRRGIS
jgi:hypothetical protein